MHSLKWHHQGTNPGLLSSARYIYQITLHLTLMMTSAQVVETSVTVTNKSPFQDYPHPNDHTTRSTVTPELKKLTVFIYFSDKQDVL